MSYTIPYNDIQPGMSLRSTPSWPLQILFDSRAHQEWSYGFNKNLASSHFPTQENPCQKSRMNEYLEPTAMNIWNPRFKGCAGYWRFGRPIEKEDTRQTRMIKADCLTESAGQKRGDKGHRWDWRKTHLRKASTGRTES